eukprot:TRINITY_DN23520_c0_g1_i1.p1 TRINITY_DN23520_c0_g1~~TRINITY_DN23520_c0_g1_i1.p1  ORF type:complete len:391 (+),score=68.88 TRINITY_DN23520_c0_g1_i1:38-1210(+)
MIRRTLLKCSQGFREIDDIVRRTTMGNQDKGDKNTDRRYQRVGEEILSVRSDEESFRALWKWRSTKEPEKMLRDTYELKKTGKLGGKSYEFVLRELGQKRLRQARKLFEDIPERNLTIEAFNIMFNYETEMEESRFLKYLDRYKNLGFRMTVSVYNNLLKYHAAQGDHAQCFAVLEELQNSGVSLSTETFNILLSLSTPDEIPEILLEMTTVRHLKPDRETLLCICKVYRGHGLYSDLGKFLSDAERKYGVIPTGHCWAELVLCYSEKDHFEKGFKSWRHAYALPKMNVSLSLILSIFTLAERSVTQGVSAERYIDISRNVFHHSLNLGIRSPVLWIAMFNVYKAADDVTSLLEVLQHARDRGLSKKEVNSLTRKYNIYFKYKDNGKTVT